MGTFIGSMTSAVPITLTNPIITHSFYIRTMPQTHTNISSTTVTNVAHSKLFPFSFCNIRGLSSNLYSVHQHRQSSSPHVLFLTETIIRPLDPNDNAILSLHLKCPGYKFLSSFSQVVVFVHLSALMYKVIVYLNLTLLISVFNSSTMSAKSLGTFPVISP